MQQAAECRSHSEDSADQTCSASAGGLSRERESSAKGGDHQVQRGTLAWEAGRARAQGLGMRLARSGGRPGTKAAPAPNGALLGPLVNEKLPRVPGAAAGRGPDYCCAAGVNTHPLSASTTLDVPLPTAMQHADSRPLSLAPSRTKHAIRVCQHTLLRHPSPLPLHKMQLFKPSNDFLSRKISFLYLASRWEAAGRWTRSARTASPGRRCS